VYVAGRVAPRPHPARADGVGRRPAREHDWLILGSVAFLVVAVVVGAVFAWQGLKPDPADQTVAQTGRSRGAAPAVVTSGSAVPSPTPSVEPVVPKTPVMLRAKHSSLCLDIAQGGDGAVQQPCSGAQSQLWTATPADGGSYLLVNSATAKCLDVNGAGHDDGTAIQQYTCHGQTNQQWRITRTNGFATVVNVNSNKCLDVARISKDPGTEVHLWTCLGADNQLWAFVTQP
jgi:hypothetical protein